MQVLRDVLSLFPHVLFHSQFFVRGVFVKIWDLATSEGHLLGWDLATSEGHLLGWKISFSYAFVHHPSYGSKVYFGLDWFGLCPRHSLWNSLMAFSAIGILFLLRVLPRSILIFNLVSTDPGDSLSACNVWKPFALSTWSGAPFSGIISRMLEISASRRWSLFSDWMKLVVVNCVNFSRTSRIFWAFLLTTSTEKLVPKVSTSWVDSKKISTGGSC